MNYNLFVLIYKFLNMTKFGQNIIDAAVDLPLSRLGEPCRRRVGIDAIAEPRMPCSYLRYVEDVADLRNVGRHVLRPGQRKELIVLLKGLHQPAVQCAVPTSSTCVSRLT